MRLLDLTLPALADNLALDEALLLEAEADRGGEVLRLWEWPSLAVVLGSGGILSDDVQEQACVAEQVPIVRRSSGGGTVLLGPGCLLYTLVLSYERHPALGQIASSYRYILERIADVLRDRLPGLEQAGISDLSVEGRKVSGTAQQRKRRFFLHHGTLLYNFPLARIAEFLREPPRQPAYRQGRAHEEFVRNLPFERAELRERLQSAWDVRASVGDWPRQLVAELAAQKYSCPEWTRRR